VRDRHTNNGSLEADCHSMTTKSAEFGQDLLTDPSGDWDAPEKSTRVARAMRTTAVSRQEHNIHMCGRTKESHFLDGSLCFV